MWKRSAAVYDGIMGWTRWSGAVAGLACFLAGSLALPQVIDFESNGLHYKTLTKNGLTIMFASLPAHVRNYSILQVAVENGSPISWTVKPEDFLYIRADGQELRAQDANLVVDSLVEKAGRGDVIKLVTTYEGVLYGNPQYKSSTNGYEVRRQSALAEVSSTKIKAAAAASAIAFVKTKLNPGESTDGAVFFDNAGKQLGPGKLEVHAAGALFEFDNEPASRPEN